MKTFSKFLSLALASLVMLGANAAVAQVSYTNTPLLVIRFNQPRVMYQQPLYTSVKQAFAAKPNVMFNLVSLVPVTADKENNAKLASLASSNVGMVVNDMIQMGIPQNRIRVSNQSQDGLESHEIHMFVE